MSWNFQREESNNYSTNVPEGKHRVRIKEVEKAVSKTGNDMLILQLEVSGYTDILYHYIVFLPDRPQITNRNLTQLYDSFKDIPEGNKSFADWIGKVGACTVKHEEYNGNINAKVGYFIHADKQGDLPAWVEPGGSSAAVSTDFVAVPDGATDEVPF